MDTNNRPQIWLVDAEDFLARLLRLKLATWPVSLNHLDPKDLDRFADQARYRWPGSVTNQSAVVVSLPQPGRSSGSLMQKISELFPKMPILYLVSKHDRLGELEQVPAKGHHRFSKPMLEWDRFFSLLQEVLTNPGELIRTGDQIEI